MIPHGVLRPTTEYLGFKIFITISIFVLATHLYIITHPQTDYVSHHIPSSRDRQHHVTNLFTHGDTKCVPEVSQYLIDNSITKHAICRKHSPFTTRPARIATATAHFGPQQDHYQKAYQSHLLHSLIHGTEIHVMCNAIVDDLWNKPAFLLNLLMHELTKSEDKRLEWIMWVDRDTLILDQCRPMSSFLPPEPSRYGRWWNRSGEETNPDTPDKQTYLLVNNDYNGLNNGVFIIRVNEWAVRLFNAILAFRHFNPNVELKFTEQSAMEKVIGEQEFRDKVQYVPQHWFNGYPQGGPEQFKNRTDEDGLGEEHVRRGDYLVHFAGNPRKDEAIHGWAKMLEKLPDVWEHKTIQRDISQDIADFWKKLGY